MTLVSILLPVHIGMGLIFLPSILYAHTTLNCLLPLLIIPDHGSI